MVKKSKTEEKQELKEYKNDKPKGIEAKCKALFMKIKI
jgi:hypothetical protein